MRAPVLVLLTASLTLISGCPRKPKPAAPDATVSQKKVAPKDPAVAGIPLDPDAPDDPARLPRPPADRPLQVAARYILVTHVGTEKPGSSRGKEDAEKRAFVLARAARKQGASFASLAQRFSETPETARGITEVFSVGEGANEAFLNTALGMGENQVADPVHTPFGYYVIQRVPLEEYSTAHILVMFQGARLAPPGMKRSKEDAREKAEKVVVRARKPDARFALLASRYSDSPSKLRGGVIAPIRAGKLIDGFEPYLEAVSKLPENGVSDVVETPYGFHIIRRLPLHKILVSHLVIAYVGAVHTPRTRRTKGQAEALAYKVRAKALAPDADFAKLAEEFSDGPSAVHGGRLPPLARGGMDEPRFEQYAFALKPGQVSDVVRTKYGFHVIKRLR